MTKRTTVDPGARGRRRSLGDGAAGARRRRTEGGGCSGGPGSLRGDRGGHRGRGPRRRLPRRRGEGGGRARRPARCACSSRRAQKVRRGDLLAEIDSDELRAALAEARAHVAEAEAESRLAEANLARRQRLAEERILAANDLDRRTATSRRAAPAARRRGRTVTRYEALLAKSRIAAPIAGTVIARKVDAGQMVEAGDHAFTVADLGRLRIEGEAHEADAGAIALGASVTIEADGYPGRSWKGRVEEIPDSVTLRRLKPQDPSRPTDARVLAVKVAFAEPLAAEARDDRGPADRGGGPLTWPTARGRGAAARRRARDPVASALGTALPFFWRRMRASFAPRPGAAPVVPFTPAALRASPALTWIGHATFYVRQDDAAFLTDPVWSERASPLSFAGPRRLVPPGVPLDALPQRRLRAAVPRPLRPHRPADDPAAGRARRAVRGADGRRRAGARRRRARGGASSAWWESAGVGGRDGDVRPRAPLLRPRASPTATAGSGRASSCRSRSRRFYHAGDTALFDGFAEIGRRSAPIDVACLPIGAYQPRAMMAPGPPRPRGGGARRRCDRRRAPDDRHALRHVRPRRRAARRAAAALPGRGGRAAASPDARGSWRSARRAAF